MVLEARAAGWLVIAVLGAVGGIFTAGGWLVGQVRARRPDFAQRVTGFRDLFHPLRRLRTRMAWGRDVRVDSTSLTGRDSDGDGKRAGRGSMRLPTAPKALPCAR